MTIDALCQSVIEKLDTAHQGRQLVALSGAPGSGKSTLSAPLAKALTARGLKAEVVPMDGFHLDNRILSSLGLLPRKGAPETFDAEGLWRLVKALPQAERLFYPTFDREEDLARAGAGLIDGQCNCVIVEGNYLLFDAPIWRELAAQWDLSIRLDPPLEVLQQRLIQRWLDFGLPPDEARERAIRNDMKNARLILEQALPATITL